MSLILRKSEDRGKANFGWLESRHSFSFGSYHDPAHMGFGPLRVINEDRVAPGGGFPAHPHSDMEILSYVVEGALTHKDSLGTGSVIRPGDLQRMSAGTGIRHSEFNASDKEPVHFLQIWIIPGRKGLRPGYEQKSFDRDERLGTLRLIGSRDGRQGSVRIHQEADLYASILEKGTSVRHEIRDGQGVWVQLVQGSAMVNGILLTAGDGLATEEAGDLRIEAKELAEVLVFDLLMQPAVKHQRG